MASHRTLQEQRQLEEFFERLNLGIEYFNAHQEEAVEWISGNLDYDVEDAREWLGTVRFAGNVRGVQGKVVDGCLEVLRKAGVLGEGDVGETIGIRRGE